MNWKKVVIEVVRLLLALFAGAEGANLVMG